MEINSKRIAAIKGLTTKANNLVKNLNIKNQDDYTLAGKKFIELKKLEKEFKAGERYLLDPINEARNRIFSLTRPVRQGITTALEQLSSAMEAYERKIETKRLADTYQLENKVKAGEMTLAEATDKAGKLDTVANVEGAKGKMHTRQQYELYVEDQASVPEEFKTVDMALVRQRYNATGQLPNGIKLRTRQVRVARTT